MVNIKEDVRLNTLNHSCAHMMAQAIKHLYPHAKFWVGPVIEDGFYYDIDLGNDVIKEEDFAKIVHFGRSGVRHHFNLYVNKKFSIQ